MIVGYRQRMDFTCCTGGQYLKHRRDVETYWLQPAHPLSNVDHLRSQTVFDMLRWASSNVHGQIDQVCQIEELAGRQVMGN